MRSTEESHDIRVQLLREHSEGLFRLYKSEYVTSHKSALIRDCKYAHSKFTAAFPNTNSTASTNVAECLKYRNHQGYLLYNAFSLAAPSPHFHELYRDLLYVIKDFVPDRNLYIQAWLNFQTPDEVLGWHTHDGYKYHGYISIDPKSTTTEFEGYEIQNKVCQIYIGKAFTRHRVVNNRAFSGRRITIGFDIIDPGEFQISNRGFIPLAF